MKRFANSAYAHWFTSGMRIKRYIFIASLGSVMVVSGFILTAIRWQQNVEILGFVQSLSGYYGVALCLGLILLGLALTIWALWALNQSLLSQLTKKPQGVVGSVYGRLRLSKGPHIVTIGGGTGLSNLLRGLRQYTSNITAVVAVSDDGGSSGRLRDIFDMPAPGDLNDCIAALSDHEVELSQLLEYRFTRGKEFEGHTLGNLIITALMEAEGDFAKGIHTLSTLLNLCGRVYPATSEAVTLSVRKTSGQRVLGESQVEKYPGPCSSVSLLPRDPRTLPEVATALLEANVIVLGPGSLFTSLFPPILVPQIRKALLRSEAKLVYVCNIMTERGETDGFDAWDHVQAIKKHLGRYPDTVLLSSTGLDPRRLETYASEGAEPVAYDEHVFAMHNIDIESVDLLSNDIFAQHDSTKLAAWLHDYALSTAKDPVSP